MWGLLGRSSLIAGLGALVVMIAGSTLAYANVLLTQVSSDPYTNTNSQHRTQVEPDTFAFGNTIVSVFQTGRIFNGGSADIGFATSLDKGVTWTHGFLPGITPNQGGGVYQAVSDPAVTFDAAHNVWLISSLGITGPGGRQAVLTSRSSDGKTFGNPVTVTAGSSLDKNWIVCDNTATSPFFGHCYTEYDIPNAGDALRMQTSTDGGLTWGPARATGDNAAGLGGQPVVRPNGTVIDPYLSVNGSIRSFRSVDGGQSWRATVLVSNVSFHPPAGNLRAESLPSAEVDGAGTVYVAWPDCRFRAGCSANDILISKSTSETTWGTPARVPIDATSSTVDHFTPGIGVDRSSSGSGVRIGLTYYFYPTAGCSASTCMLDVGYISSTNGGASWSAPTQLAGPMTLSWLPNTSLGRMFGDYISTSVLASGNAVAVIPVAAAPNGAVFDQAMFAPTNPLPVAGGARTSTAAPVLGSGSARAALGARTAN